MMPTPAKSINPAVALGLALDRAGTDTTWTSRGACVGDYPEWWFPVERSGRGVADYGHARDVCGGCPVRAECLDYALRNNELYGIWGGLSPRERDDLRRRGVA